MRRRRRYLPLFQRVAALNVALLVIALGLTILIMAPHRVSAFRADEEGVLVIVLLLLAVGLNVYLLRRIVRPVQTLTALVRRVDLTGAGERMPVPNASSEASELAVRFNEMLARLEAERRDATGRVLAGQEAERLRIAQELHDQVGQELTAGLLGLARVESIAPTELKPGLSEVQETVRSSLEDVRQIAIELRPEALDDLGLESALAVLAERLQQRTGLRVHVHLDPELPQLSPEVELVVYRVAQEALTNVARHSGAPEAALSLAREPGRLVLAVTDRGRGLPADHAAGTGIRGMMERAALIGGRFTVWNDHRAGGCRAELVVPLDGVTR